MGLKEGGDITEGHLTFLDCCTPIAGVSDLTYQFRMMDIPLYIYIFIMVMCFFQRNQTKMFNSRRFKVLNILC